MINLGEFVSHGRAVTPPYCNSFTDTMWPLLYACMELWVCACTLGANYQMLDYPLGKAGNWPVVWDHWRPWFCGNFIDFNSVNFIDSQSLKSTDLFEKCAETLRKHGQNKKILKFPVCTRNYPMGSQIFSCSWETPSGRFRWWRHLVPLNSTPLGLLLL